MNASDAARRWLSSFGTIVANAGLQALALIIFARSVGSAEYAVIVITGAVALVAAEFVGFGTGDLLIRDVSRDQAAHRGSFAQALWLTSLTLLPVAVPATLVAGLALGAQASWPVLFALVTSEMLAIRYVFMSEQIAVAHHATHAANAIRIVASLTRFGAVCLAVFIAGVTTAAGWAVYAVGSAIIAAAVSLIISARRFGAPDFSKRRGAAVHVGVLFSAMQIIRAFQYSIDKFAVALLAGPAVVGAFGIASRVAQLGTMPTSAVTRITYPMFFAQGGDGLDAAVTFARRIAPVTVGIAFLSSIALVAVAFALPTILGDSFVATRPFLLLMALLPIAAAVQNIAGSVLSGADHHSERVGAMLGGVLLTVASTAAGGFLGGVTGAIIGYMAGQLVSAVALWVPVERLRRPPTA